MTSIGTLIFFLASVYAGCLEINRSGETNLPVVLPSTTDLSIETWLKIDDSTVLPATVTLLTTRGRELTFGLANNLVLRAGGTSYVSNLSGVLLNQWMHVRFLLDRNCTFLSGWSQVVIVSQPRAAALYVNGLALVNETMTVDSATLTEVVLNGFNGARILCSYVAVHTTAFNGTRVFSAYSGNPFPTPAAWFGFDNGVLTGINNGRLVELCDVRQNVALRVADGANVMTIDGVDDECEWSATGVDKFAMQVRSPAVASVKALYNSTHVFLFYNVKDATMSNRDRLPSTPNDFQFDSAEFFFIDAGDSTSAGLHLQGAWNLSVRAMGDIVPLAYSASNGTRNSQRYTIEMAIKLPIPPTNPMPGRNGPVFIVVFALSSLTSFV